MAEINLMPVCTNCRKIIDADISIELEKEEIAPGITAYGGLKITPERCPICDARFTEMAMPEAIFEYMRRLEIEKNH